MSLVDLPYAEPSASAGVSLARADAKLAYRPELDGLRAFAVIPVIIYHLAGGVLPGGRLGVDVFFVISGFLITSIIKREADAGALSFKRFWGRRIRRILPAMIAVTAASLLFTLLFVYRPDQPAIGRQASWALLSGANIYFWKFVGSYWGMAAGQSPFLHMWSLAIEEQFYLFVPPTIWLMYKFAPRHLLACILAVAACSLAMFAYEVPRHPDASFYLLPTRAWELAAGCALAVAGPRYRTGWWSLLGLLGLAMIIASYFLVAKHGLGVTVPVLGTVLIIAFARNGAGFSILSNPVAVYIGKLSYSLYLWHWPVIVFPSYMDRHLPLWASLALMTALAMASYYLVEKPTRHVKGIVPYIVAALFCTTAAAAVMGFSHRVYDTSGFETPQLNIRSYDCNPKPLPIDDTWASMNVLPNHLGPQAYLEGGLLTGTGDPQVVVLGDSHATFWGPVVRSCTDRLNVPASFWIMSGVSPFFSVPAKKQTAPWYISEDVVFQYDQARIRLLKQWKPRVVIVASRWSGKEPAEMREFFDYLSQVADHVLLIEQAPELPIGDRNALQYLCYKGYKPEPGVRQFYNLADQKDVERGRSLLQSIAAEHPNCSVVTTHDLYENGSKALVIDGRQVVYMDDDHLTDYGASLAEKRIEDAIRAALK